MNNLKKLYEEAENNREIKDALISANEKAKEMKPEDAKKEIIKIGKIFGYDITDDDFKELTGERKEGEMQADELAKVAGGAGGCFVTNAGCTLFGEFDKKGGCFLIGAYRD